MKEFAYTLKFKASTQEESIRIMDAVTKLVKNLSPADLQLFADKVEKNPGLIQKAKKYI